MKIGVGKNPEYKDEGLKLVEYGSTGVTKNNLLIIPCSDNKFPCLTPRKAFDCYVGEFYQMLKNYFFVSGRPDNLSIYIVSGKYGLIPEDLPILPYNSRLTKERAVSMNAETIKRLKLIQPVPDEIFINLGKEYMPAINGIEKVFPNSNMLFPKLGDIGFRKHYMKVWLGSLPYTSELLNIKMFTPYKV